MFIYNNEQLEALAKNYYEMFNNKFMYEEEFNRWEDLADFVSSYVIKLMVMLAESTIDLIEFNGKIQNDFDDFDDDDFYISINNESKIKFWAEWVYEYTSNDLGKDHIKSIKAKTIIA